MKENKFLFSVVIPACDAEEHREEAVLSVLDQSIGSDNIQLILINDGSADKPDSMSRKYSEMYPDSVFCVETANEGCSCAVSAVTPYLQGRYVNFMDPEDVWDEKAFQAAAGFFEKNPDVCIASARMVFPVRKEAYHLDYEYEKTCTVDIDEVFDFPLMSAGSCFVERELLSDCRSDQEITASDGMLLINKAVLDTGSYGLIREAVYYSRKKDDSASALDMSSSDISYYTEMPERVLKGLAGYSTEKKGFVHKYIQYLLITDIQWRLFSILPKDVLTDKQTEEYTQTLRTILGYVDDDVIAAQRKMSIREKVYAVLLKNGGSDLTGDPAFCKSMLDRIRLDARLIEKDGDHLLIRGLATEKYVSGDVWLYAEDSRGNRYDASYKRSTAFDRTGIDPGIKQESYAFTFELPVADGESYSFYLTDGGSLLRKLKIRYGKFSRLNNYQDAFFVSGGYLFRREGWEKLSMQRNSMIREKTAAFKYHRRLSRLDDKEIAALWEKGYRLKKKKKRPVWIISDRSHIAGDNGEALFEYLMKNGYGKTRDIYFLLEEDSEDFKRLSGTGRVLKYGSEEHLLRQMEADLIISSHADNWVIQPFEEPKFFRNLLDYKFVFLQHGIIQGDMSEWLYSLFKNIRLFITSAKTEYDSIANDRYDYDASVVKMTGLARHDRLTDDKQKIIAIAPTWRKSLTGKENSGSRNGYFAPFKDSEYFRFYNGFINDKRLLDAMKEAGYRGRFYLHPAMAAQAVDFSSNECIEVCTGNTDYSRVFRESALFITDYSSAAMDFAMMKKPVIYTQFDHDDFFRYHLYERGIFDYERDGFGPVCYNYEDALDAAIEYIRNDCDEPEKYKKRVDSFFAYTDRNNCRRIAGEIEKL